MSCMVSSNPLGKGIFILLSSYCMHVISHAYLTQPDHFLSLFKTHFLPAVLYLLPTQHICARLRKCLSFLIQWSLFFSMSVSLSFSPYLLFPFFPPIHLSLSFSFLPVASVSFLILFPAFPPCSRKVTRSESARVDRHSSRRHGSSRAKQFRSRSDVDLQPPATTPTTAPFNPQLLHP